MFLSATDNDEHGLEVFIVDLVTLRTSRAKVFSIKMELQLQIFLIIGVGSGIIAALILSNILLIVYVVKLYRKLRKLEEREETNR